LILFSPVVLPLGSAAAEPAPSVKEAIDRGLAFLAKDNMAWKKTKQCTECHHAPFTIWALSEGKKQGYMVDEKELADLTAWAVAKDIPAKAVAKQPDPTPFDVNEAPVLLALGIEAGEARSAQKGLKKLLSSIVSDQNEDGSWKLSYEFRPIGSSSETLTTLALLALTAPNAPDMGQEGKMARERGLQWLRAASADQELQAVALRLILWRRLRLPAGEWEPLVKKLRDMHNADGGWSQTKEAKSDAYATGQALYALAEAGVKPGDETVRKAQAFLANTQGQDGAWPMVSRAIMRDGKPPKNLDPITHAGSAWAVMGLVRTSPIVTRPAVDGEGAGQNQSATPAELYKALRKEYDIPTGSGVPLSDAERLKFVGRVYKHHYAVAAKFVELAEKYPNDPVALDCLIQAVWQVNTTPWPVEIVGEDTARAKAFKLLLRDHIRSDKLGPLCQRVSYGFCKEYETFLREVLEKNPHKNIQATACLALGRFLNNRLQRLDLCRDQPELASEFAGLYGKEYLADLLRRDCDKALREMEGIFEQAAEKYAGVNLPDGDTVAGRATAELFAIRNLSVGRQAPDIEGQDQDGKRFNLSDYRGKVVLLDFWSYV
jgi:hypothetical protein